MKHIEERKKKIAVFLSGSEYTPMTIEELCIILDVPDQDKNDFRQMMKDMQKSGIVKISKKGRYTIPPETSVVKGTIQGTAKRFYFLIPDDKDKDDVFIAPDKMNGAMHQDSVLVKLISGNQGDRRLRGEVVQVLNTRREEVLGVIEKGREVFVVAYDKRMGRILIEPGEVSGYSDGDIVAVEITHPPIERKPASGRIIEIIAVKSDAKAYFKYLTRMYGYETVYPAGAVEEAKKIEESESGTLEDRKDFRNLLTVTIDGEDAKDLDDAVSIEKADNGNYRLWVHIADVSHYVRENSELDKEAADRGTSVYLVDRVIPMLPEILSNGLCSLNPNEDKLAFSVMMNVDKAGNVLDAKISESIINSNERMTYKNVHKLLNNEAGDLGNKYDYLLPMFRLMLELSGILRKKRHDRGSIDFDFKESKIIMENGNPVNVTKYDTTDANHIIEEFMLLCNETVAEEFEWNEFPFIFRVHDRPDPGKMNDLNTFLKGIGYGIKSPGNVHPATLRNLIESVKGKPVEHLINTVVLRSLKKAVYSTDNNGHFGLSSENYCHFTSPIRRYPDLMIHRLIKKKMNSEKSNKEFSKRELSVLSAHVNCIAQSSSEMERKAEKAERDITDYYKAVYMEKHIGGTFRGVVSGVTGFGMFVELENTVEGLVKVENLEGYYIFDRDNHVLYMKNGPGRYTLGKSVKVKVVSVNKNMGEIDMVIASDNINQHKNYRNKNNSKKQGYKGKDSRDRRKYTGKKRR